MNAQIFELWSSLAKKVRWDTLGDLQPLMENGNLDRVAQELEIFFRSGGRVNVGDLKISTAHFDPVAFMGQNWKIVAEEHDGRNDTITEIDFSAVGFSHSLNEGEKRITGEEKLTRLRAGKQIRYGANAFFGLWNDHEARKENSVLETLFRTRDVTYLDFFGDVLLGPCGARHVLYLYRDGDGRWDWYCHWLDDGWERERGSAVSQVST